MKIKIDFVTNSSSASFMIPKSCINAKQIGLIFNHIEVASSFANKYKNNHGHQLYLDPWQIEEDKHTVKGDTSMDNFDMQWFLKKIGVPLEYVHFSGSNYGGY